MKRLRFMLIFLSLFLIRCAVGDTAEDEIAAGPGPVPEDESGDCHCELETYGPEVQSGYIKSYNYPKANKCIGKCTYIILPHPNKTVTLFAPQLDVFGETQLDLFTLVMEGDSKLLIPHTRIRRTTYYGLADHNFHSTHTQFPSFKSAINAGFELHYVSKTRAYHSIYKIAFDRSEEGDIHEARCGDTIVEVGEEETVVQERMWFEFPSGCVYQLRAKTDGELSENDEFLVTFQASDQNLLALRSTTKDGHMKKWRESTEARQFTTNAYNSQIVSRKIDIDSRPWKLAKVTAKLIRNVCKCGRLESVLDAYDGLPSVSLTSPGWPVMSCPELDCSYGIGAVDHQPFNNEYSLLEIKLNTLIGKNDRLIIMEGDNAHFDTDNYPSWQSHIEDVFAIKQQNLTLRWRTLNSMQERKFQVNFTQIHIPFECACLKNNNKITATPLQLDFSFPPMCSYIFCSFSFQESHTRSLRLGIDFKVEGALDSDRIVIGDEKHFETFKGSVLHTTKRFESHTTFSFRFFREHQNSTGTTHLTIFYDIAGTNLSCDQEAFEYNVTADNEVVVSSPGFPLNYADDQECKFTVRVPKNHRLVLSIDEISLENFHDHVTIYQGNWSLVKSYTGHIMHQVINITESTAILIFKTDQSTSNRGFHITASAIPTPIENKSYTLTIAFVAFLLLLIAAVLAAILFYLKRREKQIEERRRNETNVRTGNENQGIALISGIDNARVLDPEPLF